MKLLKCIAAATMLVALLPLAVLAQKPKGKDQLVTISTPQGDIKLVLFDDTPQHKANFLKLAKDGFYDGTTFHRVIDGFMIQGETRIPKTMTLETMARETPVTQCQPRSTRCTSMCVALLPLPVRMTG
ncbi:hypothetical protein GCM10028895_40600 [Pontibacter rugosus]